MVNPGQPLSRIAEHETRHLHKLGTVRVGHKIVVGGIAESASEAFGKGIRHGEIDDNYGKNLYSYRRKYAERESRHFPEITHRYGKVQEKP